ncbi:MAG: hypothetical protein WDZ45_12410 [Flavobacteriaceae bacterium]
MKKLLVLFILTLLISSCQNKQDTTITGIWNNVVKSTQGYEYMEAHINDTSYLVISNYGLKYLALYEVQKDTLYHYIYDSTAESNTIIDTVKFNFQVKNNSLKLINSLNPEAKSEWFLIEGEDPSVIYELENKPELWKSFAVDFKQRFKENYLDTMRDKLEAQINLMQFDMTWDINPN